MAVLFSADINREADEFEEQLRRSREEREVRSWLRQLAIHACSGLLAQGSAPAWRLPRQLGARAGAPAGPSVPRL